eukprot:scaffold1535_cov382-Prasinococcus_capsulatus_cf.AAC.34
MRRRAAAAPSEATSYDRGRGSSAGREMCAMRCVAEGRIPRPISRCRGWVRTRRSRSSRRWVWVAKRREERTRRDRMGLRAIAGRPCRLVHGAPLPRSSVGGPLRIRPLKPLQTF